MLLGSTTIRNYGLDPNFSFSGAVTVDGDFNIEGNATVLGRVTAEEFIAELSSSSTSYEGTIILPLYWPFVTYPILNLFMVSSLITE